jgi:hypothetical protein
MLAQLYQNTRPYLYHLTDRLNLTHILETNRLYPAAALMETAGRNDLLQARRISHERITVGKAVIMVRDQAPLHRGSINFDDGYTFDRFVESLNRRIFFWPGTVHGPISYGMRHFERYEEEGPIILRVLFQSLLAANPSAEPRYCGYNSGSPRCSYGNKSPRGVSTFLRADEFGGTPSKVVEVTFNEPMILPADTKYGRHPSGPWRSLS